MLAATSDVAIIYVPADCGSILPGKSKAPQAFREIDIAEKLRSAEQFLVTEHHALDSPAQFSATPFPASGVRNEDLNVSVCERVYDSISRTLTIKPASSSSIYTSGTSTSPPPPFQLVLGGECGMLPGILSAFWNQQKRPRVGLIYIDADTDLATPADSSFVGTFASMNMTHLLKTPGALPSMSRFCQHDSSPLCDASSTVFFGTNMHLQSNTRSHFQYLFDNDFKLVSAASVVKEPEERARSALNYLVEDQKVDVVVVHLDVDAIDPSFFPLANIPNFTGVAFDQMMRALKVFMESEKVGGLVVAEVNPDHDPGLEMTGVLMDSIVGMLKARGERERAKAA